MASSFPTSLDSFTNPSSTDAMDSVSVPHATQHADLNDAVEALEAKVGADSSAVTSSHDYKIAQLEADVAGFTSGKILQVVRATDSTLRTTTSATSVDANISVTITPTAATSDILLMWTGVAQNYGGTPASMVLQITDSSNTAISGAESMKSEISGGGTSYWGFNVIAYDSPATTSATTYKGRYRRVYGGTLALMNADNTAQLLAIEVGA
jgi:hypothetical protein